jgi:hypothetical protein
MTIGAIVAYSKSILLNYDGWLRENAVAAAAMAAAVCIDQTD